MDELICATCGHGYSDHYDDDGLCEGGDEDEQCACRRFVDKDQLGLFVAV